MANLRIDCVERQINYFREKKEYGSWCELNQFNVDHIYLDDDDPNFVTSFDALVGDKVFLLVMEYSHGDSFGTSSGNGEVLYVFKDEKVAKEAYKVWRDNIEEYSIKFLNDAGDTITLSNPAAGYFENCEELDILTFTIEED